MIDLIVPSYLGGVNSDEANVYQKTVDYPDEWANGYHVMLDTEELVTVRWDQVEEADANTLTNNPRGIRLPRLRFGAIQRSPAKLRWARIPKGER